MGVKKTTSLKALFWKFTCMLLIGLAGSAVIPFCLFLAGTGAGWITYANYSEQSVKSLAPVIAATPDVAAVQLPVGCKYLLLDKRYHVMDTSLEGGDLDRAMEYAISGKENADLNKQYLLVTRENEYVVLQYYIGSQFLNEWLYRHFPPPEILLVTLIGINCVAVCVLLTAKFAGKIRTQLAPLFEATKQIAQQDLNFEVGYSKITEFEAVLRSFSSMKDSLKSSLEKQWRAEQLQREQIAALAHDLKTPLTVIQGNIDLLSETALDGEQRLYAGYLSESAERIGAYIKTLIEISRAADGYPLNLEEIDVTDHMERTEALANSLCLAKGIKLRMTKGTGLGVIRADKLLLDRAVMNVIDNAIDHSPPGGTVYIDAKKQDGFLQISILDEGSGFTPEALHHAQERFFMGNKSRTSNLHFGMGLYITSSIVKRHNGQLRLENSSQTKGARVIIKIPYKMGAAYQKPAH